MLNLNTKTIKALEWGHAYKGLSFVTMTEKTMPIP